MLQGVNHVSRNEVNAVTTRVIRGNRDDTKHSEIADRALCENVADVRVNTLAKHHE